MALNTFNIYKPLPSASFSPHYPTAMSFFRRKEPVIPPVDTGPTPSRPPPPSGSTYVRSRDGDLSNNQQPSSGRYGGGDEGYRSSRGTPDSNRAELFAGYDPERAGPNRFAASSDRGPAPQEPAPGEEKEEDVEGIKQQIRATKQESVNSTRNALRLAREAEETARGTLLKLGDQSGAFLTTRHRYMVLIS